MKKGKLVGIVTDQDLRRTSASDATTLEIHELLALLSDIKVKSIMTKDPITVPFDYTVEETAEVLLKNSISGAPVVDYKGQIVGTITESDLFRVLISLTGVGTRGIQLAPGAQSLCYLYKTQWAMKDKESLFIEKMLLPRPV